MPIAAVIRLILYLNPRQAFHTIGVLFLGNQSEEGSILCKPIGAKLWASTSSRPTISTSVNTTWRTASVILEFMEYAEPTPTFFYFINSDSLSDEICFYVKYKNKIPY